MNVTELEIRLIHLVSYNLCRRANDNLILSFFCSYCLDIRDYHLCSYYNCGHLLLRIYLLLLLLLSQEKAKVSRRYS